MNVANFTVSAVRCRSMACSRNSNRCCHSNSSAPAAADDCPNGGTVRFGVEPYDTAAQLVPIYEHIGKLIGEKLGCKVKVYRHHQLQRRDRGDAQRQAGDRRVRAARLRAGAPGGEGPGGRGVRHEGRQAGHLLGQPRHLSRLRHQDGGGHHAAIPSRSPIRPRPRATCSRPMGCARPASIRTRTSRRSMPAATRRRSRRCTTTRSMPAN